MFGLGGVIVNEHKNTLGKESTPSESRLIARLQKKVTFSEKVCNGPLLVNSSQTNKCSSLAGVKSMIEQFVLNELTPKPENTDRLITLETKSSASTSEQLNPHSLSSLIKFSSVKDDLKCRLNEKPVCGVTKVNENIPDSGKSAGGELKNLSKKQRKRLGLQLHSFVCPVKRFKAIDEEIASITKSVKDKKFYGGNNSVSSQSRRSRVELPEFVILRFSSCKQKLAHVVLEASARFCNIELRYDEKMIEAGKFTCVVYLAGQKMVFKKMNYECTAEKARLIASDKVLSRLRISCCSIVIKDQRKVSPFQIHEMSEKIGCLLEDPTRSNTISKPHRSAIKDPAFVRLSNSSTSDKDEAESSATVKRFMKLFQPEEDLLIFPGLSKYVKTKLYEVSQKASCLAATIEDPLRPHSILSRHRSVKELINCLRAKGGGTPEYCLVDPFVTNAKQKDVILKPATFGSVKGDIVDKKPDSVDRSSLNKTNGVTAVTSLPSSSCSSIRNKILTISSNKIKSKTSPDKSAVVSPVEHVSTLQFVPLTFNVLSNVNSWLTKDEILLKESVKPFVKSNPPGLVLSDDPLRFVIVRMQSCSGFVLSPLAVLDVSAELCDCTIVYHCSSVADGIKCCINLNGVMVGQAVGDNAFRAKMSAAHESLCHLSTFCPTIIVMDPLKQQLSSFKDVIAMEQLQRKVGQCSRSSDEWYDKLMELFSTIFEKYFKVPHSQDLIFTPEITSQERSMLIAMAEKRGIRVYRCLDSKSFYCLILARLRDPFEIVEHVRANSGKTLRYRLFEPQHSAKS